MPPSKTCKNCRERHVKCDGGMPVCKRCSDSQLECRYLPSRRGRRTQAAFWSQYRDTYTTSPDCYNDAPPATSSSDFVSMTPPTFDAPSLFSEPDLQTSNIMSSLSNIVAAPYELQIAGPASPRPLDLVSGATAINSSAQPEWMPRYYALFHQSHPILPPAEILIQQNPERCLLEAMEHAAVRPLAGIEALDLDEYTAVADSLQKVQGLLIWSILAHSQGEPQLARVSLGQALAMARRIGLNQRDFYPVETLSNPWLAESARRTWWELIILDGLLGTFQFDGRLISLEGDGIQVLLPGEEESFAQGLCGLDGSSYRDLQQRHFNCEDTSFSSFAYRVDAAMILRDVLAFVRQPRPSVKASHYDVLDARIVAWLHSIPPYKQEVIRPDGSSDEMMFQAYLIAYCARIYLNMPQAGLLPQESFVRGLICGSSTTSSAWSPGKSQTAKVIGVANGISELACLPVPPTEHTPFTTCFLVLSSVVHLGACASLEHASMDKHRHFLALNVNILRTLGSIWPLALRSSDHIKRATREIYGMTEVAPDMTEVLVF